MNCNNCGFNNEEGSNFCGNCGKPLNNNQANSFNNNANSVQNSNVEISTNPNDSGNVAWVILGFFFPLIGIILYIAWRKEKPRTAKKPLIGAIISIVTSVVVSVIFNFIDWPNAQNAIVQQTCNIYGSDYKAVKYEDMWACCPDNATTFSDKCIDAETGQSYDDLYEETSNDEIDYDLFFETLAPSIVQQTCNTYGSDWHAVKYEDVWTCCPDNATTYNENCFVAE